MFKSLLRTIPTLSGNMTLSCKLDEFEQLSQDNFSTYIRNAIIMPLQNKYYSKKIDINIFKGRWESDVARYFLYYSDNFYEENFTYLKDDYKFIDLQINYDNDSRNKDYEFGCKRINYDKTGYQFQFYAPFYIDNYKSFPDYFKLNIKLNSTITKTIKIYIGHSNSKNYILNYLKNYVQQIDSNVININQYNALGIYYGIDVNNGGFIKKTYSFLPLINEHILVSKFDKFINHGFVSNKIIMKQIIPISFMFNIDDVLTLKEQKFFHFNTCKIWGSYYDKYGNKLPMYDFNIDYTNTQIYVKKYDTELYNKKTILSENIFGSITNNENNFFLKENNILSSKFTNKITPTFNKWKLLGSDDDNPYIINNSPNFILQNSKYNMFTYHSFPINITQFNAKCIIEDNNLILPSNKTNYNKYSKILGKNFETYISVFENIDNIFNIINDHNITDTELSNKSLWTNVINHTSFNHNILYNFNYNDEIANTNIDKFGIFMNLIVNTNPEIFNSKYVIETKYTNLPNSFVNEYIYSENPSNIFNFYNTNYNAYIYSNENFEKSTYDGNYIVNDNIKQVNKFLIWNKSDNVVLSLSKYYDLIVVKDKNGKIKYHEFNYNSQHTSNYNDIALTTYDKITGYVKLKISQYDILNILYNFKKRLILEEPGKNVYESIIINYGNDLYLSSANNSSKILLHYIYEDAINEYEIYRIKIKQKYKELDEDQIDKLFKENINSMHLYNLYVKSSNIVSLDKIKEILFSSYVESFKIDDATLSTTSHEITKESCSNYKHEAISVLVNYLQESLYKEYSDETKLFEYVPMNNEITNVESTYFSQYYTYENKILCDYTNICKLIYTYDNYSSVKEYLYKKPNIAFIKCTNNDQIECYVEHILSYINLTNDNNKLQKIDIPIWIIDKKLVYDKSTNIFNYEYIYNPVESYTYNGKEIRLNEFDQITISDTYTKNNSGNFIIRTNIIREIIENLLIENPETLYLAYYVFPVTKSLLDFINNYINNKEKHHSVFLYESEYEQQFDNNENKILNNNFVYIANESIENNYKDVEHNYLACINYLKIFNINNDNILYKKPNDYEYMIYIDNIKDYKWDNTTNINDDISKFIKNMKLYKLICNKMYNFIYNNIHYNNSIYDYISEEILNTIISNKNSSINTDNDILNKLLYVNGLNINYNLFTFEQLSNIISLLRLEETYSNYIYEIIETVIFDIMKNVLLRIYNNIDLNDPNIEESYIINDIKFNYILNDIVDITIFKKYQTNTISNNEYKIVEHNGKKYLYFLFDYIIDNKISSYNIGYNSINSNYINTINNEKFDYNTIKKYFEYLIPINNTNIINTYMNMYKQFIVIPKNNVLNNKYIIKTIKQNEIINNFDSIGYGSDTIYDLYKNDDIISKYSINRYFGYITPCINIVNNTIENIFSLKFKNTIKNINSDVLYKDNINIYKYNPLRIYYLNENNEPIYKNTYQYEYKHFNDNLLYNLIDTFKISDIELYTYETLLEKENTEISYHKFKEYILDKIKYITKNEIDENILLFLFNNYKVSYESEVKKFDVSNSIKLYKLTYVYKLI